MLIPEVRGALLEIATELDNMGLAKQARDIRRLVIEMWRRPRKRKAPDNPMKRVPKHVIRAYAALNPDASYMEIANAVGESNTGRISEAIAGKRT